MNLEVTKEELRVLNLALQSLVKHKEEAEKIYAGYKEDIELVSGLAGKVRALHTMSTKGI